MRRILRGVNESFSCLKILSTRTGFLTFKNCLAVKTNFKPETLHLGLINSKTGILCHHLISSAKWMPRHWTML